MLCLSIWVFNLPTIADASLFNSLDPRLDAMPASVIMSGPESFTGQTSLGQDYFQYRIVTDESVRIQKFMLGDIKFYISDYGLFEAEDDLQALSIYFSLV